MRGPYSHPAARSLTLPLAIVSVHALAETAPAEPAQPVPASAPWVALIVGLAWPVAAIVVALVFRRPLGEFFSGLAQRVTKPSAFKVELELAKAPTAASSPLLDDIRTGTAAALISDSTRTMLEQAQSNLPADYAEINIGSGEEWLTSRLYIAAVMLERMRGVKVFVFLEDTPRTRRRFVAIGSVSQVRWRLAQQFPWLEAARACAYPETVFPACGTGTLPAGAAWVTDPRLLSTPSPFESATGALLANSARSVVSKFIDLLEQDSVPTPQPAAIASPSSVVLGPPFDPAVILRSMKWERASWMTRELLDTLLPREAFDLFAAEDRDAPRMRRTRSVLRRPGPFVALVRDDREYIRLPRRDRRRTRRRARISQHLTAQIGATQPLPSATEIQEHHSERSCATAQPRNPRFSSAQPPPSGLGIHTSTSPSSAPADLKLTASNNPTATTAVYIDTDAVMATSARPAPALPHRRHPCRSRKLHARPCAYYPQPSTPHHGASRLHARRRPASRNPPVAPGKYSGSTVPGVYTQKITTTGAQIGLTHTINLPLAVSQQHNDRNRHELADKLTLPERW